MLIIIVMTTSCVTKTRRKSRECPKCSTSNYLQDILGARNNTLSFYAVVEAYGTKLLVAICLSSKVICKFLYARKSPNTGPGISLPFTATSYNWLHQILSVFLI